MLLAHSKSYKKIHAAKTPIQAPLRIGLIYNLKRITPNINGQNDHEAEFDTEKTINHIAEAIASFGHEVIKFEADAQLINHIQSNPIDIAFNIAEGVRGRGRESLVPAILDLLDIEYTGSDAATMALTLDKYLAKKIVSQHGIRTANAFLMHSAKDKIPPLFNYPLFIKPVAEGSSKGISPNSVVHNESELRERVSKYIDKYTQAILVEEYISGREFTVGLIGNNKINMLPILEIKFMNPMDKFPVYSFEYKLRFCDEVQLSVPAQLSSAQKLKLENMAKACFLHLGCRDVSRIDFRMNTAGEFYFIECNPLPGLSPNWSDLCIMANGGGIEYNSLIASILAPAIKRLSQKKHSKIQPHNEEVLSDS